MLIDSEKFSPPVLGETATRARLLERIRNTDRHLWISAPAGYGKTTLAASIHAQHSDECLWYRFDHLDHDPAGFFLHFPMALHHGATVDRLPKLTVEFQGDIPAFARHFAARLQPLLRKQTFVLFDDYHVLPDDSPLHRAIPLMLEALRSTVRVAVASRGAPPPGWVKLELDPGLDRLDQTDLAFDASESLQVARLHGVTLDENRLKPLMARTAGWITGLVLLLRSQTGNNPGTLDAPESVFRYYASEVVANNDPAMLRFLSTAALLPRLTSTSAERLTGIREAGRILRRLHSNNLFMERTGDRRHIYRFHPLFREYLLDRLGADLTADALDQQKRMAADVLIDEGDHETAVALLLEANDYRTAARIACAQAAHWVEQGRWAMLLGWLEMFPEDVIATHPWCRYWKGVCLLYKHTATARGELIAAYHAFHEVREWEGLHLAWCAIVQSILFEFGDYTELDQWLDRYAGFAEIGIPRAQKAIRLRQNILLFSALMARRPDHPRIPRLERTLYNLVFFAQMSPTQRLQVGGHLLRYYAWTGDLHRTRLVVERLRRTGEDETLDPFSRQLWTAAEAMYAWYGINPESGLEVSDRGLASAEDDGIHLMDFSLLVQAFYAAMALRDYPRARDVTKRVADTLNTSRAVNSIFYYFARVWLELIDGDCAQALERSKACLALGRRIGIPYYTAHSGYCHAQALFRTGDLPAAIACNEEMLNLARRYGYRPLLYGLLLNRAQFARADGDAEIMDEALSEALALGHQQGYQWIPFWRHNDHVPLLVRALEKTIEPEFTKTVIRSQEIRIQAGAVSPAWPYAVQIHTLGGFAVKVDGQPLRFGGKVQHRPLDLLKLLLVSNQLPATQAAAILWPEADADKAFNNLKITLSRLRKLIGSLAIRHHGGRLTLNESHCWCDYWVLLHGLAANEPEHKKKPASLHTLYRGELLPGDDHLPAIVHARDTLRVSLLQHLRRNLDETLQGEAPEQAVMLAEAALTIDPLAEPFYRGLMRAYMALGNWPEAVRVYRRCQKLLADRLGITPSPATRAVYIQLLRQQDAPDMDQSSAYPMPRAN